MVIFQANLTVKAEHTEAFEAATRTNGEHTRQEAGNIRFECFKQANNTTQYMLLEIYADDEAVKAHFDTPHFNTWYTTTKDMVSASSSNNLAAVFPPSFDG